MNPLIEVRDVAFSYAKKKVLHGINLSVEPGEIVTLLGPNGCGKSTLIKIMIGLLRPLRGSVCFEDRDVAGIDARLLAQNIAYVPQIHRSSFPYRVLDIALMGRIPHKGFFFRYSAHDLEIARSALRRLSISHLADRAYTEISGGERQLTIIARALAQGANTFVMDEPANGLDYGNQLRLLEQITALSSEGYTFIKSTHSPEHALWLADRAVLMKEGRIVADGACSEVVNSANLFDLYGARVDVVNVDGSCRFCVPRTMGRGNVMEPEDRKHTQTKSMDGEAVDVQPFRLPVRR